MEPKDILGFWGIKATGAAEQIYRSAWDIDDTYILKNSADKNQLEKSVALSDLLLKQGISAPEYLRTPEGGAWVPVQDTGYVLMRKIRGHYCDPYKGDPFENGVMLGGLVAKLHLAMQKIGEAFACYEADFMQELDGWMTDSLKENAVHVPPEILDYCRSFGSLYASLPRHLIHRDLHLGNMLFSDGAFSGYLDFDMSQKNVRLHDVCYLGLTMLVDNDQDKSRFDIWRTIFRGVLTGYQETFALTDNEIRAIPYMFVLIELIFAAFYAQTGQADTAAGCVGMTERLYRGRDRLVCLPDCSGSGGRDTKPVRRNLD